MPTRVPDAKAIALRMGWIITAALGSSSVTFESRCVRESERRGSARARLLLRRSAPGSGQFISAFARCVRAAAKSQNPHPARGEENGEYVGVSGNPAAIVLHGMDPSDRGAGEEEAV